MRGLARDGRIVHAAHEGHELALDVPYQEQERPVRAEDLGE